VQTFLLILCFALIVFFAITTISLRSLVKSAISLAIASVLVSIVLFLLGAHWAALFELSVCAGLITAVFISAISFSTPASPSKAHESGTLNRFKLLPYILIVSGLALLVLLLFTNFKITGSPALPVSFSDFKQVFWQNRQVDIVAQIALILAGTFAVVVMFKEPKNEPENETEGSAEDGGGKAV